MKKIKIKDKEFKIIPEARLVQGKMHTKWIETHDMKKGYKPICRRIIIFAMNALYPYISSMWSSDCYINANAYCDEKDTFDEKTGIEVCSAKLELKNHLKLLNAYTKLRAILIDTIDIVADLELEHAVKARAIEADLAKTYGRMEV